MEIEFSFTAFDDFPAIVESKSKQVLLSLKDNLRNSGLGLVYLNLIKMAAIDTEKAVKNIHRSLSERSTTYPLKKQILIHLFDNLADDNFQIQDRARNEASFTTDVRNYRPRQVPINPKCPIFHTLTSSINIQSLSSSLSKYTPILLNHEKLYLDNFIFYSSLRQFISSGVVPILVYIPNSITNVSKGLEFVIDLCIEIKNLF